MTKQLLLHCSKFHILSLPLLVICRYIYSIELGVIHVSFYFCQTAPKTPSPPSLPNYPPPPSIFSSVSISIFCSRYQFEVLDQRLVLKNISTVMAVMDIGRAAKRARRSNIIYVDLYDFSTIPTEEVDGGESTLPQFRDGVKSILSSHVCHFSFFDVLLEKEVPFHHKVRRRQ